MSSSVSEGGDSDDASGTEKVATSSILILVAKIILPFAHTSSMHCGAAALLPISNQGPCNMQCEDLSYHQSNPLAQAGE